MKDYAKRDPRGVHALLGPIPPEQRMELARQWCRDHGGLLIERTGPAVPGYLWQRGNARRMR